MTKSDQLWSTLKVETLSDQSKHVGLLPIAIVEELLDAITLYCSNPKNNNLDSRLIKQHVSDFTAYVEGRFKKDPEYLERLLLLSDLDREKIRQSRLKLRNMREIQNRNDSPGPAASSTYNLNLESVEKHCVVLLGKTFTQLLEEQKLTNLSESAESPLSIKDTRNHFSYDPLRELGKRGLTKQVHKFVGVDEGRFAVVDQIRSYFAQSGVQVIAGLGGVGKTTTALEYVFRSIDAETYGNQVFWTNACSPETLRSDFMKIAQSWGCENAVLEEGGEGDPFFYRDWVFDMLEQTGKPWLLVYDNADDRNEGQHLVRACQWLLENRFISPGRHGRILITSRSQDWYGEHNKIELQTFREDESLNYLTSIRQVDDEEELTSAECLAKELGYLPVALAQAGAYIRTTRGTFQDYLALFRETRLTYLEQAQPREGPYAAYNKSLELEVTVGTTWRVNVEALEKCNPLAVEVLSLSAFLAPERIPASFFIERAKTLEGQIALKFSGNNSAADRNLFRNLLADLNAYSLIRLDGDALFFDIHRLVQEFTRSVYLKESKRDYLRRILEALYEHSPFELSMWGLASEWLVADQSWVSICELYPHVKAAVEHALESAEDYRGESFSHLLGFVGGYLLDQHNFQAAEQEALKPAFDLLEQNNGVVTEEAAFIGLRLARLYRHTLRFKPALELLGKIECFARLRKAEDEGLLEAYVCRERGQVLQDLRKYDAAEKAYVQALDILRGVTSLEDRYFEGSIYNCLGNNYRFWHRYEDALRWYEKSHAIYEELGTDNLIYLRKCHNLAKAKAALGHFEEALKLQSLVLDRRISVWGRESLRTAPTLSAVGTLYHSWAKSTVDKSMRQDRFDVAWAYLEEAFKIYERSGGLANPRIEAPFCNLCSLYSTLYEEFQETWKQLLDDTLNACETSTDAYMKPTHKGTVHRCLGDYYAKFDFFNEAEQQYQLAIEAERTFRPEQDEANCLALSAKGRFYSRNNEWESAIQLYKEALGYPYRNLRTSKRAEFYGELGRIYNQLARNDEKRKPELRKLSRKYLYRAIQLNRKFAQRENCHVANSYQALGVTLSYQNRCEDAQEPLETALRIYKSLSESERRKWQSKIKMARSRLDFCNNRPGRGPRPKWRRKR